MISRRAIREFAKIHPDSLPSLSNWYTVARRAEWKTFVELSTDFSAANQVGRRTVFNVGGGKYRLIARVNFGKQRLYVLFVMKHSDYNRDRWK